MTWNYRALEVKHLLSDNSTVESCFYVIEVFYDEDNKAIESWCFTEPYGDSLESLTEDLVTMLSDANSMPALQVNDLPISDDDRKNKDLIRKLGL